MISSLPLAYTSDSLSTLLSSVGPIRTAFIVTAGSSSSGSTAEQQQSSAIKSKGYGFAKFVLKDDAERAIQELNSTLIDGKKISVQWAKRRHRGDGKDGTTGGDAVQTSDDFVPLAGTSGSSKDVNNVKNAYAARRDQKRVKQQQQQQDGDSVPVAPVDNYKDARSVVLEGGLDVSDPIARKALQKKLKKVVFGINTGSGALQVHDVSISALQGVLLTTSNNEEGKAETVTLPQVLLECPTPKTANELAEKLHNTVIKGHLVLARVKFESDLVERKGPSNGGGRLIVRNLGFDVRSIGQSLISPAGLDEKLTLVFVRQVTHSDLATAFCRFGPLQSIHLRKGYAFVWFVRRADAESALASVNGTRVYHGMHADRVEEAAKHELSSTKRKKEKGRIVGLRGRVVAVDWALGKAEYQRLEEQEAAGQEAEDHTKTGQQEGAEDGSDMEPVPYKTDDEDEDEDDDEEDDENADLSPIEETDLAAPSDAESDDEAAAAGSAGVHKPEQGSTLFIRNVQFEATEDELYALFKAFGPVRYARIVMDPVSKRSRGTGFVNFYKEESALACLEEADKLALTTTTTADNGGKGKAKAATAKMIPQSLLTADPSSALAARLTLHGRVLGVSSAVSKGQADSLREERDRKGGNKDRRNLYLMHEGSESCFIHVFYSLAVSASSPDRNCWC